MTQNRIISIAGIDRSSATRFRVYCKLIKGLRDNWLIADDFVDSHVSVFSQGYLDNIGKDKLKKSQIIIVLTDTDQPVSEHSYQLTYPLTAQKIKVVLNRISNEVEFKEIQEPTKKTSNNENSSRLKSMFAKIKQSFSRSPKRNEDKGEEKKDLSKVFKKFDIEKPVPFKIVLMGSPGSGKTTSINSLSSGKSLSSEVSATDSVANDKQKTTIGIDYAEIKLDDQPDERSIRLIGTPGQLKYNFVWDMVGNKVDAFVVLLDLSRPNPVSYFKFYYQFITERFGHEKIICCTFTHCDKVEKSKVQEISRFIRKKFAGNDKVFRIDPREKSNLMILLKHIKKMIDRDADINEIRKIS